MLDGEGNYVPNTVNVDAERYWGSGFFNPEQSTFDATYVKLRELKLGYTLPNKLLGNLPLRNVSLSVVGRNLALWTKVPHIDPEVTSLNGGTIIPGVEDMQIPSTRSMGFNLNFQF